MSQADSTKVILAGTTEQLRPPFEEEDWLFIDLGFSNAQESNGVIYVPKNGGISNEIKGHFQYGELIKRLQTLIAQEGSPLNIVLEAPLSMAFDEKGNPIGRSMEKEGGQHRYWYTGPGGPLVTAADRLLRKIGEPKPNREVRIFEGFVSFKGNSNKKEDNDHEKEKSHERDANLMRELLMEKNADLKVSDKAILENRGHELCPIPALGEGLENIPPILFVKPKENQSDRVQGLIYSQLHH